MHSAWDLVADVTSLTSLPSVYLRIREEVDRPDASLNEISTLVSLEPALAARLLQIVNSALYGYDGKIDCIHRAVTILGMQQVHDFVLAMSVGSVFSGVQPERMDMQRFWHNSAMCGSAAREIAKRYDLPSSERMLVVGLLADLGHLVMYQTVPVLADQARQAAEESNEALHEAERRIVGCDHANVGATLMDHWRLPPCFAQVVGAQTDPELATEFTYEAAVLHIARHIVAAEEGGATDDVASARVVPTAWALLGLHPGEFGMLREAALGSLCSQLGLFFPHVATH